MSGSVNDTVRTFFGRKHAIPVGSGTVGLRLALEAVPVRGRRVLIPALACPNVAVSVLAAGGIPTAVEMSGDTYDFSLPALEGALAGDTAAIVAVDAFGYPSDVAAIAALAPSGCALIEDACQAYGGRVAGVPVGSRGDVGVVSFGYAKPLELMGGGLVVTDNDDIAASVQRATDARSYRLFPSLKNHFALKFMMKDDYARMLGWHDSAGLLAYEFPGRLLRRLPSRFADWTSALATMKNDLERARAIVDSLPGVEPFAYDHGDWLPWRYSVKVPQQADRAALVERLAGVGVRTSRLYRPVSEFLEVENAGATPVATRLAEAVVNLAYRTTPSETASLVARLERLSKEAPRSG